MIVAGILEMGSFCQFEGRVIYIDIMLIKTKTAFVPSRI